TAAVAAAHGATIVREPRRGYGRACTVGADRARGEVVVFLDADGAADPQEIARLLAPIASGGADLVLGSRLTGEVAPGAMPWHQRVGNRLCAFLIRSLYGQPLTDLGPFRAVRRVRLKQMTLCDLTYGWPTEMIVKAVHAGWRIAEVPVTCHVRTGGRSKISGTLRGTTLATFHILRTIVRHARPMSAQRATGGSVVAIMAKQPAAGRTKTRLCPPLSPSAAAELYEALLNDTIMLVSSVPDVRLAVAITPGDEAWRPAVPGGALFLEVEGSDIGACLSSVIRHFFDAGYSRVIALDSDSPTLPATYIEQADTLLDSHDLVVGPSEDGGYYLVGLRQPRPELFRDIAWSTPRVTAQTLDRAAVLGLSVAVLPAWYDVDTAADLQRLRVEVNGLPPDTLRSTRRFLAGCQPATVRELEVGLFQHRTGGSRREEISG
ncbi:MAG: TIGR04282 family arsenosugar biosynthesis glycosyltransferase, partial [Actinobacteria bacterium]|nr:TIGR04282 family arsenosugar biosynthesis glycosyltransferase [Actinomycetota bacterium]